VLEPDCWNLAPAKALARQQSTVARDHVEIGVDEDWDVEPEGLDAAGDLTNLLCTVLTRVAGVRLHAIKRNIGDRKRQSLHRLRC
jgi:hypothetical protein